MFRFGQSRARSVTAFGALSAVGLSFVLAVAIGAGFGYVLDGWLGTSPWFFLIFFFVGVAAGVLNVFRIAASYLDDTKGTGSGAAAP